MSSLGEKLPDLTDSVRWFPADATNPPVANFGNQAAGGALP